MKHAVQVTILGQQYTVRTEASAEEVRRVADFVNQKIAEVAANKAVDTLNTAVLALMNVAGAYLQLLDAEDRYHGDVEGQLQRLLERLEQACPSNSEAVDGN